MAMALSFASMTRRFHTIGMRFCSQRRLKAAPTRIHGRPLTMRTIEAGDAGLVGDLLMRLSEHACWLRYSRPRLAVAAVQCEVERMLRRDRTGVLALVATMRRDSAEEAVALAELMATDSEIAEVAIVVRDDYQGQGLGRVLMCQIVRQAVSQGLRTLRFDIRRENTAMQCLVQGLGLPYRGEYWPDEVCLWVDLPARSYA
jgi:GNAT superfamily N-acetyltransferase